MADSWYGKFWDQLGKNTMPIVPQEQSKKMVRSGAKGVGNALTDLDRRMKVIGSTDMNDPEAVRRSAREAFDLTGMVYGGGALAGTRKLSRMYPNELFAIGPAGKKTMEKVRPGMTKDEMWDEARVFQHPDNPNPNEYLTEYDLPPANFAGLPGGPEGQMGKVSDVYSRPHGGWTSDEVQRMVSDHPRIRDELIDIPATPTGQTRYSDLQHPTTGERMGGITELGDIGGPTQGDWRHELTHNVNALVGGYQGTDIKQKTLPKLKEYRTDWGEFMGQQAGMRANTGTKTNPADTRLQRPETHRDIARQMMEEEPGRYKDLDTLDQALQEEFPNSQMEALLQRLGLAGKK